MKRKIFILGIMLLLLTNSVTMHITKHMILNGDRIIISDADYMEYQALKQKGNGDNSKTGKVLVDKDKYETLQSLSAVNSKVEELEDFILDNYYKDFNREDFEEGILKGVFEALGDPYSLYMNKEEFGRFLEDTKGTYSGVGIIVAPKEDGMVTVVSPIEDTPAERAGIHAGDKILKVDDFDVTSDLMDEAVRRMRGKPGEKVYLKIFRPDDMKTLDIPIIRENIRLKTVKSDMKGDIAYIRISTFDALTSKDFKIHLSELLDKKPKGLIIDLRNNPGGSVSEVVKIADILLGKQLIVYTEDRNGHKDEYKSGASKVDLPMVVLTNRGSASASEILAGAIQDTKSGTIIGEQTFGKGVIQTVFPLKDDTGFKLTTSEYFTPNGKNIHGIGITPDIVIEMPKTYYEIENPTDADDVQLQKALNVLQEQINKGE